MTRKSSIQKTFLRYMLLSTLLVVSIAYGLSYAIESRITNLILPAENTALQDLTKAQVISTPAVKSDTVVAVSPDALTIQQGQVVAGGEIKPSTATLQAELITTSVHMVKTNTVSEYQKNFLWIFTLLILLQLAISLKFIQKILIAPLHESAEAINRLAEGHYDLSPSEPSSNEIKQLHHQLYRLSEELLQAKTYKESSEFQRKTLIAGISHDLKTPLTNIKGYSETLLMDSGLTAEQTAFLGVILRNADVANDLISDLSDMNRLDLMQYPLREESVDIAALLETCIEDASLKLQTNGQVINFVKADEVLILKGDAQLYQRLIKNLISNFLKHAGNETTLCIDWRLENGKTVLSFSDNGAGVASEELHRLTDLFYMSDHARTVRGNSGLGLYNSLQIAKLLGSELRLDGALGEGLRVEVWVEGENG